MTKIKKKKNKKVEIRNGFLYPAINSTLNFIKNLCLVEGFKFIGKKLAKEDNSLNINYSRIAVDIFILAKWMFLIFLWVFKVNSLWAAAAIWYLLATNLYTYFYYHLWCNELFTDRYFYPDRIKRRFNNLMLAVSYTIFGFAYLYNLPYAKQFSWSDGSPTFVHSLWFSISTSLTATYEQVKPITDIGNNISMLQLLTMFVFLTILIGGSVPQMNQVNKKG